LRADCHIAAPNRGYGNATLGRLIDIIGVTGAALTTLCWLPQALKVVREKETRALSLPGTAAFTVGVGLWLLYGLGVGDWPLIGSNAVTLALPILAMKLRYG
jgi:MtN3 and saliva related transmembrane protein